MKTISICAITDEKYPFALATMFVNVLEKCPNTFIKFYCLVTGSLPQEDRLKILSIKDIYPNCSITLIDLGNKYMDLNCTHKYVTKACWYKFSILEEVQEDKILYLDTDVLVKRDLTELFETDMQDNYLGGVVSHEENQRMIKKLAEKGFAINDYINAGIMLMNLKQMRQDNILEKLEALMKDFPHTVDQDIFNIVCTDRILYLDEQYNYLYCYTWFAHTSTKDENLQRIKAHLKEVIKNPTMIHYAGKPKPWLYSGMKYGEEWFIYFKKTPYVGKIFRRKHIKRREWGMFIKRDCYNFIRKYNKMIYNKTKCFIKKVCKKIYNKILKRIAKKIYSIVVKRLPR